MRVILHVTALAYSIPIIPVYLLVSLSGVVPGIFSEYYGVPLSIISYVVFLKGLFDTFTDPIIGYCADRYYVRTGSRRLFVVGGMLLLIPCAWFLFIPYRDSEGHVSKEWFVFWFLAFCFSYTCILIPHMTWGGELSNTSSGRILAFGYRSKCLLIGGILFYIIPLLPMFPSTKITPETIEFTVHIACLLLLFGIYILIRYVPIDAVGSRRYNKKRSRNFLQVAKILLTNRPYILYLVSDIFWGVSSGIYYGTLFIFVDAYLDHGDHFVFLILLNNGSALASISPAIWLTKNIDKRHCWGLAIFLKIIAFLIIFISLEFQQDYPIIWLYFVQLLIGMSGALLSVAGPSLLTDIIDYSVLRSKENLAGTFFSMHVFSTKFGSSTLGPAIGLFIISYFGFTPNSSLFSDEAHKGFAIAMSILPVIFGLFGLVFVLLIPIDTRRRKIIRKRLDILENRENKALVKNCLN